MYHDDDDNDDYGPEPDPDEELHMEQWPSQSQSPGGDMDDDRCSNCGQHPPSCLGGPAAFWAGLNSDHPCDMQCRICDMTVPWCLGALLGPCTTNCPVCGLESPSCDGARTGMCQARCPLCLQVPPACPGRFSGVCHQPCIVCGQLQAPQPHTAGSPPESWDEVEVCSWCGSLLSEATDADSSSDGNSSDPEDPQCLFYP